MLAVFAKLLTRQWLLLICNAIIMFEDIHCLEYHQDEISNQLLGLQYLALCV